MTNTTYTGYELEAYNLGVEAAKTAASWIVDGNTKTEFIPAVLEMLDNGDPAADDYLPAMPTLSGEWADDPTPISLYEEITGSSHVGDAESAGLAYETLVGSVVDAIADAWEAGVSETFEAACEAELRRAAA